MGPEGRRRAVGLLGPDEGPGLLALRHALAHDRPGLLGDDPRRPRCVVLAREGDGHLDLFAAGRPEPAVPWLAGERRAACLLAPEDWEPAVQAAVDPAEVDRVEVQTWFDPPPPDLIVPGPPCGVRPLTAADAGRFASSSPGWALRGWGSFAELARHGAAFGVPHGDGFAALAWVFDQSPRFDALGVFTAPRFRRLGLGRAAASALLVHVLADRRKLPLWSVAPTPGSAASHALAAALGFSGRSAETVLRWSSW